MIVSLSEEKGGDSMNEFMNIPIGFRFDPTDEELITYFLLRKVNKIPLPWNGMLERDLYGENRAPWDVFQEIDESSPYWYSRKEGDNSKVTKKIIYVFTKLTKVSSNSKSKRISRKAGCGTWNGQTAPKKIKDSKSGEIIGLMRMLSFQHSKTDTDCFGHWIMHEYALDGVSLMNNNGGTSGARNTNDLVLCKITKQCLKENGCRQPSANSSTLDIQIPICGAESSNKRHRQEDEDGAEHKRPKLCSENDDNNIDQSQSIGESCCGNYNNDIDGQLPSIGETLYGNSDDDIGQLWLELDSFDQNWSMDELLQEC